jgi:NADPH2 dehydrogenase
MSMKDPLPTLTTFVERVRDAYPNLAYMHVVEPRVDGIIDLDLTDENRIQSNGGLRKTWGDRPYITAGVGRAAAINLVEKYGGLVAFGRHFIANVSPVFGGQWSNFSNHIAARSPFAPEGGPVSDAL